MRFYFLLCFFCLHAQDLAKPTKQAPLILVSFDGFRWDYPALVDTPEMHKLFAEGFHVKRMEPSFPTITFPNHYTLVSGFHPGHHGLVTNHMYDRSDNSHYDMYAADSVNNPKWYQKPAIWEVTREHGLTAASYFWVGSQVWSRHPETFVYYDKKEAVKKRFDALKNWLDLNEDPNPDLILLYFHEVDTASHYFGIDSVENLNAIQFCDTVVGRIREIIAGSGRAANLILVSDHGMIAQEKVGMKASLVRAAVGSDLLEMMSNYSQADIFLKNPSTEKVDAVFARLPKNPKVTWYRHDDVPGVVHPTRNGDILGIAAPGYYFMRDQDEKGMPAGHGYNEKIPEMGAICMGVGPAFQQNVTMEAVRSVDVFSLLLKVLGLPNRQTDGRLDVWGPILKVQP